MKLKREKIKNFFIPDDYLEEMLDVLEEGLKDFETDLEDEVVYTVINNIIEFKFEEGGEYKRSMGTELEKYDKEFFRDLVKRTLEDENKLDFWYNYEELYERVTGKQLRTGRRLRREILSKKVVFFEKLRDVNQKLGLLKDQDIKQRIEELFDDLDRKLEKEEDPCERMKIVNKKIEELYELEGFFPGEY